MAAGYNPEAIYDCLTIVSELQEPLRGVSQLELQHLTYLACVLSLYRSRPAAEWGYHFARTPFGTPFSGEMNDALELLLDAGHLSIDDGRYRLNPSGTNLWAVLHALANCAERDPFLNAACGSALALPSGAISLGLNKEPTIVTSEIRARGATLLEGPALHLLHGHFDSLTAVLPMTSSDLLAPSVLWLTYMAEEPVSKRTSGQSTHGA